MTIANIFNWPTLLTQFMQPPQVAQTPSELIYSEQPIKVYHYLSKTKLISTTPILIINSLVNRYYILDLVPGKSYVEYLVNAGFNVYMIDWGVPDYSDRFLTLADYIDHFLVKIVAQVLKHAQAEQLSMIGYCMGGTMAVMYAAIHHRYLENLILLATPINFHNDSLLSLWGRREYFDVDKFIDTYGNAPKEVLYTAFMMLNPLKNYTKYVDLAENIDNPEYIRIFNAFDYWIKDTVAVPGEIFREFIKYGFQLNLLMQHRFPVGHRMINLKQISCRLLNVVADHDEIVPAASSLVLMDLISSKDKESLVVKGGHHSLSIGFSAIKTVWPKTAQWLLADQI